MKEAERAHDQAIQTQHEAEALEEEAKELERKYHSALRSDNVQRLRAGQLRKNAARIEGGVTDAEH